jgi:hypothetical protein
VNIFALSSSNPKPNLSFARDNYILNKMRFCHLFQYCSSKTAVDIARIRKVSTSPTGIINKFGIQIPIEIKNTFDLDKQNGNHLWKETIRTEIKQLPYYQTFIVLDSDIP